MATIDDVKTVLKDVLQLGPRADAFEAGTPLLGGVPEFDSYAVINVILALETRFDIVVDDDEVEAETFETIGSLSDFVDRKLAGR